MRIVRKLTHELTVDLRTAGLFPAEIGQPSSVSSRQRRARPLTKGGVKCFAASSLENRSLDSELAYLPREFLAGFSAASVLINSVANLGGFAGPYAIGAVGRTREVSYTTKLEINPKRIPEVNSMSRGGLIQIVKFPRYRQLYRQHIK